MKFQATQLLNGKYSSPNPSMKVFLLTSSLVLLTMVPLSLTRYSHSSYPNPKINISISESIELEKCDIFSGNGVSDPKGPYYTNETCHLIIDQQNCIKFGRPDTEFLKWRWKPDECELTRFNATHFFELVRGKSMAFVGDSVARNQMQSLLCLLAGVANPKDISLNYTSNTNFKRWFYPEYSFLLATFWSPYLVKARDTDPNGHSYNVNLMNLHLDEVDTAWSAQIENFDYVIISAGQWFFRPLVFYEKGQVVGCSKCQLEKIVDRTIYYGYRKAFRTAFRTIRNLQAYKGVTFLRSFSPAHFENGDWDKGGKCGRTKPLAKDEIRPDWYIMKLYLTQKEEYRAAEKEGKKRGLHFGLLDTTEIMFQRPDGHPNNYGQWLHKKVIVNDCVHWCLPGPIDTWNEFLLYLMKKEARASFRRN
ncbi:protein trichome birefringence-like 19 [Quillaja saponaria]|uniref:Protein trichome birefringence-like 19 n=1 Tax=Quillaja saponaria TaxID=32244 RepID=A0AAD7Q6J4_QUISA|nr:protein trichome birefringence-like 19 [Quillaja saponaria]